MRASNFFPFLFFVTAAAPAFGQDIELQNKPSRWRISYETLDIDNADDIGLVGVQYDLLGVLPELPPLYLGIGGFTQVNGDDSGFFLGGATVGAVWHPMPNWLVDTGVLVGGGGGSGGPPRKGWALRPFVALERLFGLYNLRAELAYLDLGETAGDWTLAVGVTLPSELLVARERELPREIARASLVPREIRATPRVLWLDPVDDATRRGGGPLRDNIEMIGVGVDYFVTPRIFLPIEAYGAVGGGVPGFFLASAGVGASVPLVTRDTSFEVKVSAVTGGGGDVDIGGELGWQAMAGLRANVLRSVGVELMGGRTQFPGTDFEADTLSLGVSWTGRPIELAISYPRGNLRREGLSDSDAEIKRTRVTFNDKFYDVPRRATKKDGSRFDQTISLAGLGIEEPIDEHLSLTARAYVAYDGAVSGYSEGLLGARYEFTPPDLEDHHFGVVAELGAGGGGNVDVGSGLLVHLAASWRYDWTRDSFVFAEAGRTETSQGSFEAQAVTIGVGWNLHRAVLRN